MEKIIFVNESEPYLSAENLNTIQDNVENEIENIKNEISGEEWENLTLLNGFETYDGTSYGIAQYKKIGNQVFLRGFLRTGAIETIFANLPEGFRPKTNCYLTIVDQSEVPKPIRIYPNGDMKIFTYTQYFDLTGNSFFID